MEVLAWRKTLPNHVLPKSSEGGPIEQVVSKMDCWDSWVVGRNARCWHICLFGLQRSWRQELVVASC